MAWYWIVLIVWASGFVLSVVPMAFWCRDQSLTESEMVIEAFGGESRWPDRAEWLAAAALSVAWFVLIPGRLVFKLLG